eukprot:3617424-Pyramimonas_sp.AAC.1
MTTRPIGPCLFLPPRRHAAMASRPRALVAVEWELSGEVLWALGRRRRQVSDDRLAFSLYASLGALL